jgi:hypothetical protein
MRSSDPASGTRRRSRAARLTAILTGLAATISGLALDTTTAAPALAQPAPNPTTPNVTYRANVAGIGWQLPVRNGATAGTTGQGRALHAIDVQLSNNAIGASLRCTAHVSNIGWVPEVAEGQPCGRIGNATNRVEAIRLRLVNAPGYSVEYRCHLATTGWTGFVRNNTQCGTTGQGRQMEAIEIRIVPPPPPPTTPAIAFVIPAVGSLPNGRGEPVPFTADTGSITIPANWGSGVLARVTDPARPVAFFSDPLFRRQCHLVSTTTDAGLPFIPRSMRQASACPTAPDEQQASEIIFYSQAGQQGIRTPLLADQPRANPTVQDAMSWSLPPFRRLAVYSEPGFTGTCVPAQSGGRFFSGDAQVLKVNLPAGRIGSVAYDLRCGENPNGPLVVAYAGENFSGTSRRFASNVDRLTDVGLPTIGSIELRGVHAVALFSEPSFAGTCETVLGDRTSLTGLAIGTNVQSMGINRTCFGPVTRPPVVLDVDVVDGGLSRTPPACPTGYTRRNVGLNAGVVGNNQALCVKHGEWQPGVDFVVSARTAMAAPLLEFTALIDCLGGTAFVVDAQVDSVLRAYLCIHKNSTTTYPTEAADLPILNLDVVRSGPREGEVAIRCADLLGVNTDGTGAMNAVNFLESDGQNTYLCQTKVPQQRTIVGTASMPDAIETPVGQFTTVEVTWEVPEPLVWRSLDHVDVTIADAIGTAIVVRHDETDGTLTVFDQQRSRFWGATKPGSGRTYTNGIAALRMRDAQIVGSGPTGRTVTLNSPSASTPAPPAAPSRSTSTPPPTTDAPSP